MYWTNVENMKQAEYWIVGDDNSFMQSYTTLTLKQETAKKFNKIGDAMRSAVTLNKLGGTNKFRVIPMYE